MVIRQWVIAALVLLAIPGAALALAGAVNTSIESAWRDALVAEYGEIPADVADEVTLRVLCQDPTFSVDAPGVCTDTIVLSLLGTVAVTAAALGVVTVLVAAGTSAVTRRNRRRMAVLLRPALVIVLLGTSVLLVMQAVLVVGIAWEVMVTWVGYIFPWLLVGLAVAAGLALIGLINAIPSMLRSDPLQIDGIELSREDHPLLFDEIEAIARRLGAAMPDRIVTGLEPNYYVVDAPVVIAGARHHGRTLFLSAPQCRLLSRDELRAVVGHELGHFRGEDTLYSRRVSPMYAAARESLGAVGRVQGHWSGIISLPAGFLLSTMFTTLFSGVSEVSRERELEADAAGAEAATPDALAKALRKVEATSVAYRYTLRAIIDATRAGQPIENASAEYVMRARELALSPVAEGRLIPHPFDTHPPLEVRLAHLAALPRATQTIETSGALDLYPADPAINLFGDPGDLDGILTERVHRHLAPVAADEQQEEADTAGPSTDIRRAARSDAGIAAALRLVDAPRGADLASPYCPTGRWLSVVDLLLEKYPASRANFTWSVPAREVPRSTPEMVVDVADSADDPATVLQARIPLVRIGQARAGPEDCAGTVEVLTGEAGGPFAGRLIVVCGAGAGEPRSQAAGFFVSPSSDWMTATSGLLFDEVQDAAAAMIATRPRDTAASRTSLTGLRRTTT